MFDTRIIGKKICSLRKIKNITQVELADLLGVSYQAVSNWERGNSMPDISKLADLSKHLDISIDDLLNDNKASTIIKNVIDGTENTYIKNNKVSINEITNITPILKPTQTKKIVKEYFDKNDYTYSMDDIKAIAPDSDNEFLNDLIDNYKQNITFDDLITIAPFLDEQDITKLFLYLLNNENHLLNNSLLCKFAPFISQEALKTIVQEHKDKINLSSVACFLDSDTLDEYADNFYMLGDFRKLTSIAPFMNNTTVYNITIKAVEEENTKLVTRLAPFISRENLKEIIEKYRDKINICNIACFLDSNTLDKYANNFYISGDFKKLTSIAPFMNNTTIYNIAIKAVEEENTKLVTRLAPFIETKKLREIANTLINKYGISSIKEIAHFL